MIRKFEKKDTERVMQIWLEVNIETHDFVPSKYWLSQYQSVQKQILQADIYVYEQDKEIQGFVGMMDDYLAGILLIKNAVLWELEKVFWSASRKIILRFR